MIDLPQLEKAVSQIKVFDVGAEAFPPALYDKIRRVNPDAYIMNGYGPTETTISCTMKVITDSKNITIGVPNGNVKVYIVDKENHVVPDGETGELVIAGLGVGRGYMNLPEKTAAVFIDLNGERAYKTGDLARISPEELSDYAAESLAHYMVPEVFIQLEKMPITQNGKIDKKALPKPIAQPKNLKEPETVMQKKIFQIVAKVVENDFFGIDTSFYKELPSSKDMMEVCKEIFPVFSNIDRCSEQTSLFKLKGAHKLSLQFLKLLICGLDHLRYKGFIVRLLYHFTSVIQIHPCEQIGMCTYCTGNGI